MVRAYFARVDEVKRLLPRLHLPGLVGVFCSLTGPELLLVYLDRLQAGLADEANRAAGITTHSVTVLDELPGRDLSPYTGPIMAMAAIDLVDPHLVTKGVQFCRLDRILRQAGYVEVVRGTFADLSNRLTALLDDVSDVPQRAAAEVAALATPRRLEQLTPAQRRGLVAYLPDRDLMLRLDGSDVSSVVRALRTEPLRPHEPLIALAEVRPLLEASLPPTDRSRHPIELRTILRRSTLDDALVDTQRDLAQAFHQRWLTRRRPADLRSAYALALESHLVGGDVDDLVAVLPAADFRAFCRTGAGTYLYRRPLGGGDTRGERPIRRVHLGHPEALPGPLTGPIVFSLLPLRRHVTETLPHQGAPRQVEPRQWADLGPVLRLAGRTEILARNAWLLVEDFLESSRERRTAFSVQHEDLLTTMVHCCEILSLTDPWRTRQGRRDEWLLEAYQTVHRVLASLIERSEGTARIYYSALDYWFACSHQGEPEGVRACIESMVRVLERGAPVSPYARPVTPELGEMRRLGRILLDMLHSSTRPVPPEQFTPQLEECIPHMVGRAAEMSHPIELATATFWTALQQCASITEQIHLIEASQIPVTDKTDRLLGQLDRLRDNRHLIFAPEHQARVLGVVFDAALDQGTHMMHALEARVALQIELQTRSIAADTEHGGIVIQVRNVGNAPAHDLEIELSASDALVLREGTFRQSLSTLAAGERRAFRFRIRVVTDDEMLTVSCRVSNLDDHGSPQIWNSEFPLRVTWVDHSAFTTKPNPYFYGPKVHQYQHFFGRREELQEILAHLAGRRPQHVLLRGARRTGKSSLLNMLLAVLGDTAEPRPVRGWFGLPDTWNSALDVTVAVDFDLQGSELAGQNPTPAGFYRAGLEALTGAGLTSEVIDQLREEPMLTAAQFVRGLRSVLSDERRLVVLVDEFDILDRLEDTSFFYGPLRHVISSVQGVTWVVASALGLSHQVRDYESPLFNIFKIIDLGALGPEATSRLILSPWQNTGGTHESSGHELQFADDALLAIVHESGQHPYFVQMLCSYIVYHANRFRTNFIQHRTVMKVIEEIVVTEPKARQYLNYLWGAAGPLGKAILLELLRDPEAVGADALRLAVNRRLARDDLLDLPVTSPEAYEASLQQLIDVSAVRELPHVAYQFAVPLLRRLVLRRSEHEDLDRSVSDALRHLAARAGHHG
ncbi:MAG: ATP-binding protein [Kineosporiaceae bacterium]